MSTPHRRRHERSEEGVEHGSIQYGQMGDTARKLSDALKRMGLNKKACDWGHQGKDKTKR
jgi:hypothetical protein